MTVKWRVHEGGRSYSRRWYSCTHRRGTTDHGQGKTSLGTDHPSHGHCRTDGSLQYLKEAKKKKTQSFLYKIYSNFTNNTEFYFDINNINIIKFSKTCL